MSITAPYCQYRKTNCKIGIAILVIAALWFAYDGFYNEKFKAKHTVDGKADHTLIAHRYGPPVFIVGAMVLAVVLFKLNSKNIVADDEQLIFSETDKISYDKIESVNKTSYRSKGFFVIDYKTEDNKNLQRKISNRAYDNLDALLEGIVSKITG